ncbi:MAG: glycosyltransferase family 2 protein [Tolumonas sp.]|nr:glycosyltransferase family 2 protein [Tolumonas sp.]
MVGNIYLIKKAFVMDISVIVVNYNSSEHTINCVSSILAQTKGYFTYEIIIVDNNSNDAELNKLRSWFDKVQEKKVHLYESKINTGFALGNMLGVNISSGRYLFLLNNDCVVINDTLSELASFMENKTNVALVSPKCLDRNDKLASSFDYIPTIANQWLGASVCRLVHPENYPLRKIVYTEPVAVPMISGAAMFFRRSVFADIGGLDTNYFLYCEEEDICLRLKNKEHTIFYVPSAVISHLGGGSTERDINIEKEFYISLFYFLNKNYTLLPRVMIKLRYVVKEFIKSFKNKSRFEILFFLISGAKMRHSLRHKQKMNAR